MQTVSFGAFQFDFSKGVLLAGGEPVNIGLRATRLLAAFLTHPGEVLTRARLVDAAWDNAAIEDSNLSVQVARLRAFLGTPPGGGDWIATAPGIGYRFAQPVTRRAVTSRPVLWVRPFIDLMPDALSARRGEQVTADIVVALSRFKSFVLHSGPAADETASYIVRGTIGLVGNRLRLSAELLDGTAGNCCWAEHFDAPQSRADTPDRLAGRLAAALELQLEIAEMSKARRDRPGSVSAYDLFLQGQMWLRSSHRDDNARAIALYLEAIALEPENVGYLAGACEALHHRIAMGWPMRDGDVRLAHDLAVRGLRLTEDDSRAISLFGKALFYSGDPERGFDTMQRAVAINPNSVVSTLVAGQGHLHWGSLEEAGRLLQRAWALNPLDHHQRFTVGSMAALRVIRGDDDGALRSAGQAFAINQNYGHTHWARIAASANLGRVDEARRYLDVFTRTLGPASVSGIAAAIPVRGNRRARTLEGLERAGLPVA